MKLMTIGLAAVVSLTSLARADEYKVVKTLPVGGDGKWDYVIADADAHRLYVPRGNRVMVLDTETGKSVGEIPDTTGVHGVALAGDFHKGFSSNGKANNVTMFDTETLTVDKQIPTGQKPDSIIYDPATQRVFAFCGKSDNVTVIEAKDGSVAGTIDLGGAPEFGATDGAGKVYVNLEDKSEIVEIDSKELKVLNHWPLAPGDSPSGLAIDAKNRRLFSGCHNKTMVIMDADSGKVITTEPIGDHVDACAFDPATNNAFSSNGDGTLTVVHEDDANTFKVAQNVQTKAGARTMALDSKDQLIFLPTAEFEPLPAGADEHAKPKMVDGSFMIVVVGK